jgi:diguanylate cyclase (GGDEF)-like protein
LRGESRGWKEEVLDALTYPDEQSKTEVLIESSREFDDRESFYLLVLARSILDNVIPQSHSKRDRLTGLLNKFGYQERLESEIERALRSSTPLSLLVIDVDHFKQFNDTYGHSAGDLVLRKMGEILCRYHRPHIDSLSRWGGEEFTLILPSTSASDAQILASRICTAVEVSDFDLGQGIKCRITVSIGVASLRTIGKWSIAERGDELFRNADAALYSAKEGGRNRVSLYVQPIVSDGAAS